MFETLLVFALGMIPPLISVWAMRKAEEQVRSRLRSAMEAQPLRMMPSLPLPSYPQQVEGVGDFIGDRTCRFNAHSAYIRCAVNPRGPCEECPHYEP